MRGGGPGLDQLHADMALVAPEPEIGRLPQVVLERIMSHFAESVLALWRLRRVARAWRDWATATLAEMPRIVAIAGTELVDGADSEGGKRRRATPIVEVLDLSTMCWSTPAGAPPPLPVPRSSHFSCVLGRATGLESLRVVVIGGVNFGAEDDERQHELTGVEWQVGSDQWRPIAPLPWCYHGANSGAVAADDTLLLFGGDDTHHDRDIMIMPSKKSQWYDTRGLRRQQQQQDQEQQQYHHQQQQLSPTTRLEAHMQPMRENRHMAAVTMLVDGRIFVAGGLSQPSLETEAATATAEMWNPDTKNWTQLPDMAFPRIGAAACVLACGDVLVVGGFSDTSLTRRRDAELFDPASLTWRTKRSHMAFSRGIPGLAVVPGGAVVTGSHNQMGENSRNVELYDEDSGQWLRLPHPMAKPRVAGSLVTLPAAAFRRV